MLSCLAPFAELLLNLPVKSIAAKRLVLIQRKANVVNGIGVQFSPEHGTVGRLPDAIKNNRGRTTFVFNVFQKKSGGLSPNIRP